MRMLGEAGLETPSPRITVARMLLAGLLVGALAASTGRKRRRRLL
jgi:hypothetical protein